MWSSCGNVYRKFPKGIQLFHYTFLFEKYKLKSHGSVSATEADCGKSGASSWDCRYFWACFMYRGTL